MALCPECDAPVPLYEEELEEGDRIACPECAAELEIIQVSPLYFEVIPDSYDEDDEDDEDWDDEDGEDGDDEGE